ncbi:MAG: PhzF family phenazine biosynthesis protein [Tahibacter sp.]
MNSDLSRFDFLQIDVFAERAGGGNPLGVVVDGSDWSDAAMQAFAHWTGLVETTFLLPPTAPDTASYRLRIFTPTREIAFAGHPSVGSAHAALQAGVAQLRDGTLVQECAAGLLTVRSETESGIQRLFVEAPQARVLDTPGGLALDAILGASARGRLAPVLVEGGRRWWIAEFADETGVRTYNADYAAIRKLALDSDSLGLCIFARCNNADYDLVVRAFPAGVGIVEDPASGAANGLIAAWLHASEPQGPLARGYRVSQGREIGHDAHIVTRIDANATVWVGGRSHTVVNGSAHWAKHG